MGMKSPDPEPLRVRRPCPLRWSELDDTGETTTRWCDRCEHSVFDASAVTEAEARVHLERAGGHACISLIVRPDGRPVHAKRSVATKRKRVRGALVAISAAILASCGGRKDTSEEANQAPDVEAELEDAVPQRAAETDVDPDWLRLRQEWLREATGEDREYTPEEIRWFEDKLRLTGYY